MGIQDRDYVRARKLDYTSKYDKKPGTPKTNHIEEEKQPSFWYYLFWGFVLTVLWRVFKHYDPF
ncbi:hypothetical protein [Propionivibrio limicola]|uniref:hypothetical protein n=1 Tax=Propionivibrio limicola TaxID=167645 RepID=UPI001290A91F|nr:hypothetical protein [Propionivibrio limicola]